MSVEVGQIYASEGIWLDVDAIQDEWALCSADNSGGEFHPGYVLVPVAWLKTLRLTEATVIPTKEMQRASRLALADMIDEMTDLAVQ